MDRARRIVDIAVAGLLLALALPAMGLIAAAVWFSDGLPVLFRQRRVGQHGKPFTILKFRTMRRSNEGAQVTSSGDARVTPAGRLLRAYKLDELPQLWNVVRGDMSLIGPRPEVSRFVDAANPLWAAVHSVKPGITDLATLVYRDEERVLAGYADAEQGYREAVLPAKLALNVEYMRRRSPMRDAKLLALTIRYSLMPGSFDPAAVKETILSGNR
jgi:lipopolysaccharide/colanic/teichoic acid biosynthesis glycosyltransferase